MDHNMLNILWCLYSRTLVTPKYVTVTTVTVSVATTTVVTVTTATVAVVTILSVHLTVMCIHLYTCNDVPTAWVCIHVTALTPYSHGHHYPDSIWIETQITNSAAEQDL